MRVSYLNVMVILVLSKVCVTLMLCAFHFLFSPKLRRDIAILCYVFSKKR